MKKILFILTLVFIYSTGLLAYNSNVESLNIPQSIETINCPPLNFNSNSTDSTCQIFLTLDGPTSDCTNPPTITYTVNGVAGAGSVVAQSFDVGIHTVEYTVIDCNDTMTCTQIVTVRDMESPTMGCLTDSIIFCGISDYPPAVDFYEFLALGGSASDNCALDTSSFTWLSDVIVSMTATDTVYNRTYRITDIGGINNSTCNYNITSFTGDTLFILCTSNQSNNTDLGVCNHYFNIPIPEIVSCDDYTLVHNSIYADSPGEDATGSYPLDTTTVQWILTNTVTNETDTCEIDLIVNDNQAPDLSCPVIVEVDCFFSEVGTYNSYLEFENAVLAAAGMIVDNCDIDTSTFALVNVFLNPMNSSEEVRVYELGDFSGNFSQCGHIIKITDNDAPVLNIPPDTTVTILPGSCEIMIDIVDGTATDFCGIDTLFTSVGPDGNISGVYGVGTTCVYWTAIDINGNMALDSTCITVLDSIPPIITCPGDIIAECNDILDPPYTDVIEFINAGGVVSDDCGLDSLSFSFMELDSLNNIITREYSIADMSGNISSCTQTVTIIDTINPVLNCPGDLSFECLDEVSTPYDSYTSFVGAGGTASDDCTLVVDSFKFVIQVSNGNTCPEIITRTYQIKDSFGNTTSCSQAITVMDISAPTLVCNADISVPNGVDSCSAYVVVLTPTVMDDNCGIETITNDYNNTDNATDVYPVGMTTVVWTVVDSCGNSESCEIDITVVDGQLPEITCPSTLYVQCDPVEAVKYTSLAEFIVAGGTVTDNCALDDTLWTVGMDVLVGSGSCVDTFSREYFVDDVNGNQNSCVQLIVVRDTIAPEFTLPADVTINCTDDQSPSATGEPTDVVDNCSPPVGVSFSDVVIAGSCPSNSIINRTWTLIDACNNSVSEVQVITVADTDAPTVLTMSAIVYLDANGKAAILPTDVDNGSLDSCGLAVILSLNVDTLDCADLGASSVILTVTDSCGNQASASVAVQVIDTIAPVATNPNISFEDCGMAGVGEFLTLADYIAAGGLVTDNCEAIGITKITEFSNLMTCPETITRMYEIYDVSNNKDTIEHTIIINDTEAPVITCPSDTTVSNDPGLCSATFDFGTPTATDNCSILSYDNDKLGNTFAVGVHTVEWIVTDACGNSDTCLQVITVIDDEAPILGVNGSIANPLTVSLTNTGEVILVTSTFVYSDTDNCAVDSIAIRRMIDNCGDPANLVDGQEVMFCCADVNTGPHVVVITAWDIYGNVSQYMSSVNIQDKIAPVIVYCPSDVTVDCGYPVDITDLSEFGKLVTDESLIEDIIINGVVVGTDGLIEENCPDQMTITESVVENISCGQGEYTRTFHVTDASGIEVTCTQSIFVVDATPFVEDSITWPADVVLESSEGFCDPSEFSPSEFGQPVYNTDNCSFVGQTYEDVISVYPTVGCKLIRRQWKVVDWCQYESNSSTPIGIYEYEQEILVTNSVAPIIVSTCNDTILCSSEVTCKGNTFNLTIDATDDCTDVNALFYSFKIDLNNDGSVNLNGNGKNANFYFKNGTHKIEWTVNDRCGNIATCDYLFTVQDCKAPAPVCLHGLTANLVNNGSVELWASDFNKASSDNCTATEDLKLSFSSDPDDFGKTFTCSDLGSNPIELWVTDEAGNQSHCNTYVIIQDNLDICPEGLPIIDIAGRIATAEGITLENVSVELSAPEIFITHNTGDEGKYNFESLPADKNYQLVASKDGEDMLGISTLDILLIQRHILKLKKFDSPYDLLAADVNNSGSVNASDIIELRKLVLTKIDELSKTDSWRFVSETHVFSDEEDPWGCTAYINYDNVTVDMMSTDFVAVKIGDVNNSVANELLNNESNSRSRYNLEIEALELESGQSYSMPIYGSDLEMSGIQLALKYNKESVEVKGFTAGLLPLGSGNTIITDSHIMMSWNSIDLVNVNEEPLFYIELVTKDAIKTNELFSIERRGLKSEVYDADFNINNIALIRKSQQKLFYQLYEATPNPFTGSTVVKIDLPVESSLNIKIRDTQGKVIYREQKDGVVGENSFELTSDKLNGVSGVLYYTISTNEFVKTKKMIKL